MQRYKKYRTNESAPCLWVAKCFVVPCAVLRETPYEAQNSAPYILYNIGIKRSFEKKLKKSDKKSCKTFAELKFVRIFAPAIRNKEVAQVLKRLFNNVNNGNVENFSKKNVSKSLVD